MEEIGIDVSGEINKILSGFNMEAFSEIYSKLENFESIDSDDNIIEILHSINGIGYEIEENVYSLPSMSVNRLNERKKQIIMSHYELARRYYDSLTFSKRLQRKLSLLNHFYNILHTKYYSTKVIHKIIQKKKTVFCILIFYSKIFIIIAIIIPQEDNNVQISMVPQSSTDDITKPVVKLTGQQALIQLAVKTGLTMFFKLLKQSWENKNTNGKYCL